MEALASTATGADGRFELFAPGSGLYRVRIQLSGRVPMQLGPLAVVEDTDLAPVSLPVDVGLPLRFVGASGTPLIGLSVFAEAAGPMSGRRSAPFWQPDLRFAKTGSEGRVGLSRQAGERLKVSGLLNGSLGSTHTVDVPGEVTVTLSAEEREIRVVDAAGQPLAGGLVRAGPHSWPLGLTDALGKLKLGIGPSESRKLRVTSPEGLSLEHDLPADPATPAVIAFPQSARAEGRVIDAASKKPLAESLVWSPADPGSFVRCDQQGRFALGAPERGRFWLEASAPGYLSKRVAVTTSQLRAGRVLTFSLNKASRFRGQVVDPSGTPLAGVWIVARQQRPGDRPPSRSVEPIGDAGASDPGGFFELGRVRPGMGYDLTIERKGFLPATLNAVAVSQGLSNAPLRITLQPAPRAVGRVVNAEGRPIVGAKVRLAAALAGLVGMASVPRKVWQEEETATVETDIDGRFAIDHLPATELDLEVQQSGFASASFRGLRVPPSAPVVDLGKIVLRPGATIRGRVVDSRAKPVSAARVYEVPDLARIEQWATALAGEEALAVTTAGGDFSLLERPVGEPRDLLVVAEGFLARGLPAVRAPTPKTLLVTLTEAHGVRGRVLAEDHVPVAEASVQILWYEVLEGVPGDLPTGKSLIKTARTGPEGEFAVEGLPAGESVVRIEASGFRPLEDAVSLPLQEPASELRFVLTRGALLEGQVRTNDDQPVAAARVSVGDLAAFSDDSGAYALEGVPLGEAEIELFHPHFKPVRKSRALTAGANRLDFDLPAGRNVRGTVLDEQGQPVVGARVVLSLDRRAGFREYAASSAEDGGFELRPVASGRYVLRASAQGYPETARPEPVSVAGAGIEGLEIVLSRGAHLVGEISGLDQGELWRLEVQAEDAEGRRYPARLLLDGRYEVRDLPLGSWLVTASLRDGERQARGRAELHQGGEETRLDLAFGEKLQLSGLVLFGGEPLADARVSVRADHLALDRAARTDHAGRFRIEDLEADSYRVGVTHGQRPVIYNGRVALAEDRDLLIDLEAVLVEGTVVDASTGDPLPEVLISLRHEPGPETTEYMIASNSGADGAFALPLVPPSQYQLQARATGYVDSTQALEVPAGSGITGLDLRLVPTTGMDLVVHLAAGRAPAQVHYVAISGADGSVIAGSQVPDAEGRLRLPTPPTGEWQLRVGAPGGGMVEVPAWSPGAALSLVLPPAAPLAVRVPVLTTSDLLGEVRAFGADGSPLRMLGPGGVLVEAWPMIAGWASLDDLPLGTWTLVAGVPDGRQWSATVTFPGSPMTSLDLE